MVLWFSKLNPNNRDNSNLYKSKWVYWRLDRVWILIPHSNPWKEAPTIGCPTRINLKRRAWFCIKITHLCGVPCIIITITIAPIWKGHTIVWIWKGFCQGYGTSSIVCNNSRLSPLFNVIHLRYDNGLQICWGSTGATCNSTSGSFHYGISDAYTFPVAFASNPFVTATVRDDITGLPFCAIDTASSTSLKIEVFVTTSGKYVSATFIAIGFWKW